MSASTRTQSLFSTSSLPKQTFAARKCLGFTATQILSGRSFRAMERLHSRPYQNTYHSDICLSSLTFPQRRLCSLDLNRSHAAL